MLPDITRMAVNLWYNWSDIEMEVRDNGCKVELEREKLQKENSCLREQLVSFLHFNGFIKRLEKDSFEGWSEEAKNGYLTATRTIKEKIDKIKNERRNVK